MLTNILPKGKSLYVPKIDRTQNGTMDFLRVYSEDDLQTFPPGLWGIKEPESDWQGQRRHHG